MRLQDQASLIRGAAFVGQREGEGMTIDGSGFVPMRLACKTVLRTVCFWLMRPGAAGRIRGIVSLSPRNGAQSGSGPTKALTAGYSWLQIAPRANGGRGGVSARPARPSAVPDPGRQKKNPMSDGAACPPVPGDATRHRVRGSARRGSPSDCGPFHRRGSVSRIRQTQSAAP